MTKSEIIRYLILRSIGNFLLLFALFGVGATFGPAIYYEAAYRIGTYRGVQYHVAEAKQSDKTPLEEVTEKQAETSTFASVLTGPTQQILVPKDTGFGIVIPKIAANEKVFANIDPSKESEFLPFLKQGVAHAKGSVFPGIKGNIYLFAHSTDNFWDVGRYNAIFYLLKDLNKGDHVIVFFENVRHNYVVYDTKVVDASDVSYLVEGQKTDQEALVLQTCWPPGTTWKRLLVFARPK